MPDPNVPSFPKTSTLTVANDLETSTRRPPLLSLYFGEKVVPVSLLFEHAMKKEQKQSGNPPSQQ